MKKLFYIIIFLNLFSSLKAQQLVGSVTSQKCLGGSDEESNPSLVKTPDGGYAMVSWAGSANGDLTANKGSYDIWVTKLTSAGAITWQKNYGGSGRDQSFKIINLKNGGYVIAGHTLSNDGDISGLHGVSQDGLLMKIDANGILKWAKVFGNIGEETLFSVAEASDGNLIAAGYTNSNGGQVTGNHGGKDLWVVKTDSNGNFLWQKCYGGTMDEIGYSICASKTLNNFHIAGSAASNNGDLSANKGGTDGWLLKIDTTGAITGNITNGGTADDEWRDVAATSDGGYIATGATKSNTLDVSGNHGGNDIWCGKFTNTNTLSWNKCIGGTADEMGTTILQLADNNYALCGAGNSNDIDFYGTHGANDVLIALIHSNGTLGGTRCFGGGFSEVSANLINEGGTITSGTYTLVSTTASNNLDVSGNHGMNDVWFAKISAAVGINDRLIFNDVQVYPTVTNNELNISTSFNEFQYSVIDINGKEIMSNTSNTSKLKLDCSAVNSGVYLLRIMKGNEQASYKFVKQ